ncbi:MAG TPA: hypothetical protein VJQ54_17655, partial [Candidatus Sulfotelmatobacter sp.]|nr:hypothetical protein [Candidatus Sulfotelmatobacter sp.]
QCSRVSQTNDGVIGTGGAERIGLGRSFREVIQDKFWSAKSEKEEGYGSLKAIPLGWHAPF